MTLLAQISILFLSFALFLILFWLGMAWLKKRQLHRSFDRLLDNIQDRQSARADSLARRAIDRFHMNQVDAKNFSQDLLAAEKVFLQQFIDQQLHKKSVENFYDHLCDLLDSYLAAMPKQQTVEGMQTNPAATAQADVDEGESKPAAAVPAEETWGDVFD